MVLFRWPDNPLIKPKDVKPSSSDFEVTGVFNAAVTRLADEIILLLRVAERPVSKHPEIALAGIYNCAEGRVVTKKFSRNNPENDFSDPRFIRTATEVYLTAISSLRLARSKDGINFEIDTEAAFTPANDYESFGLEDPRISLIDGTYYIDYVAAGPLGVTTSLASTRDFKSYKHHGVIFPPDNKDVAIFPEKINGRYYCLHRPVSALTGKPQMWISESPDLHCWGNHRYLMGLSQIGWDENRIGAGAVPFKTELGWLEIYHGADRNSRYSLGALLVDATQPWKIIARTKSPIFEPQAEYECKGFFGNVVFSCGLLFEDDKLKIYYGASDTSLCYAELPLGDVFKALGL
jgi:predicted GH43/DUF377 family glycosyl hydrolase